MRSFLWEAWKRAEKKKVKPSNERKKIFFKRERSRVTINDFDTNYVYFSSLLQERYPAFFKELAGILKRRKIGYGLLAYTKDIWCRDYMPIQVSETNFVQFKYDPAYLYSCKEYIATRTDPAATCRSIGLNPNISEIKIDGGNIVRSRTKVIMTERIFSENKDHERSELIERIRKLLSVNEIIIAPECPGDEFGHADGMIRFLDENTVLVNEYQAGSSFDSDLSAALKNQRLNVYRLPYNPYLNNNCFNAAGVYINYLQVGKVVIYPVFGLGEDILAKKAFSRCFGASNIIPIRSNEIAKEGGVLHCVSWNILKDRRDP